MPTKDRLASIEETTNFTTGAAVSVDDFKYSSSGSLEKNLQEEFEEGRADFIKNLVVVNNVNPYTTSTSLQVTGDNGANHVHVAAGRAYVNGKRYLQTAAQDVTIDLLHGTGDGSDWECYLEISSDTFTLYFNKNGYTGASNQLLLAANINVASNVLSGSVGAANDVRSQYSGLSLAEILDCAELDSTDWGATSDRTTHTAKIQNSSTGTALILTNTSSGYALDAGKTKVAAFEASSAAVGGGYGSSGVTISTDGNIQANGALTVDGAAATGALTVTGNITVTGTVDTVDILAHAHTGGTGAAQLDWDTCWADAVHSHASDAEGSTLLWTNIFSVAGAGSHAHSSTTTGGTLTWANALAVADAGTHTHAGNTTGGTLLWTNVFSVAGAGSHDHSSTTKGGAVPEAGITFGDSGHAHTGATGGKQVDHVNLANKGTNTHATIDTHLGSTSNPHSTTLDQLTTKTTTSAVSTGALTVSTGDLTITSGNIIVSGTVDGVDVSAHAADSTDPHGATLTQTTIQTDTIKTAGGSNWIYRSGDTTRILSTKSSGEAVIIGNEALSQHLSIIVTSSPDIVTLRGPPVGSLHLWLGSTGYPVQTLCIDGGSFTYPNINLSEGGYLNIRNTYSGVTGIRLYSQDGSSDFLDIVYNGAYDYAIYTVSDGGVDGSHYFHDNILYDGGIAPFDEYDDIQLAKAIRTKRNAEGKLEIDKASLPPGVIHKPDGSGDGFTLVGAMHGFVLGTLRQEIAKREALEAYLATLEARLSALESKG